MSAQQDLKRPISPQQLFQRLMQGNFKEIQCIDEAQQVKQQRQILISLIAEYKQQIQKRMDQYLKLQKLIQIRNRLRGDLEALKQERVSIDQKIQYQLHVAKVNAQEVPDFTARRVQIDELRFKNAGLQGRLRQLSQYCMKIQRHNQILQNQSRIGAQYAIRTRATSQMTYSNGCNFDIGHGACGWGQRYNAIKIQQENLTNNMIRKMRQKQQSNLKHVRLQQQQIAQRNRRKMQQFHERMRRFTQ